MSSRKSTEAKLTSCSATLSMPFTALFTPFTQSLSACNGEQKVSSVSKSDLDLRTESQRTNPCVSGHRLHLTPHP